MSETLDINKNIWLWLTATKGISNYHSAFIDGSPNINSWNEFPEFKNLVDNSDKLTSYQEAVLTKGSNFLKNFIKASMYPLFCKELKDIQQPTTNQLYFNAGSLELGSKQNVKEFCWCFRFKISLEEWKKIDAQSLFIVANKFSGSDLGFGLRSLGSSSSFVDILVFQYCSTNQSNKTICRITEFSKYADEQWHSIVVCGFNNEIKLYVDGSFIDSSSLSNESFELETITPASPFTVSSRGTLMQYADIYQFNFDMSSADAPYTITDYQQGKPIPPSLTQSIGFSIDDNFGAGGWTSGATSSGNWYKGSYVKYIADHTIDNIDTESGITEAVDLSTSQVPGATLADVCLYNKSFSFKKHAGKRIKIKGSCKVRPLIDLGTNNAPVVSFGIARKSWSGYVQLNELPYNQWSTFEFDDYIDVPTTDAVYFGIGAKYDSTTEPVVAIADLDIKVVETILALEDYTITNGTTKMVFDYSGNSNDGTITGNVMGDNDNRVQRLIDFIK
jgi:hypothetical protein